MLAMEYVRMFPGRRDIESLAYAWSGPGDGERTEGTVGKGMRDGAAPPRRDACDWDR